MTKHEKTKPGSWTCICGANLGYNEKYDAMFCIPSNEWVEKACPATDGWCNCQDRPATAAGLENMYDKPPKER